MNLGCQYPPWAVSISIVSHLAQELISCHSTLSLQTRTTALSRSSASRMTAGNLSFKIWEQADAVYGFEPLAGFDKSVCAHSVFDLNLDEHGVWSFLRISDSHSEMTSPSWNLAGRCSTVRSFQEQEDGILVVHQTLGARVCTLDPSTDASLCSANLYTRSLGQISRLVSICSISD